MLKNCYTQSTSALPEILFMQSTKEKQLISVILK